MLYTPTPFRAPPFAFPYLFRFLLLLWAIIRVAAILIRAFMFLYYSHPDDDDDDIEDYGGFSLDLDDILGLPESSPSHRISFTTSSERDRPFVRPPCQTPRASSAKGCGHASPFSRYARLCCFGRTSHRRDSVR